MIRVGFTVSDNQGWVHSEGEHFRQEQGALDVECTWSVAFLGERFCEREDTFYVMHSNPTLRTWKSLLRAH